ncbi:MAG: outer membrane lipoprotein carrier protein LolA [Rhodobacteraceae bacterium]|nr:outer membrane lipoprotein carrier protein LolA [Paracoccaceae bacterium]
MQIRLILLVPMMTMFLAAPVLAEKISLNRLSAYLNDLKTARGEFTQINQDGTISTGTLYIHRPGRMRFDYDPPSPALVMAGGGTVAIFDRKSNEPPQQFPLKRTPLSVILARDVDLGQADMITGHREEDQVTIVTAHDPENPDAGTIDLMFTADPVTLRKWVITDESGAETTVVLGDMQRGMKLGASLFNVQNEVRKLKDH